MELELMIKRKCYIILALQSREYPENRIPIPSFIHSYIPRSALSYQTVHDDKLDCHLVIVSTGSFIRPRILLKDFLKSSFGRGRICRARTVVGGTRHASAIRAIHARETGTDNLRTIIIAGAAGVTGSFISTDGCVAI